MTGTDKAAILLLYLGNEVTSQVFEHMDDDEIERVTLEIANHKQVSAEQKASVISEFYQMAMAKDYISTGGLEYAQSVLEKALGAEKAMDIMDVNPQAVVSVMEKHGVQWLIHGHTHRPDVHSLIANGEPAHRVVLGAWHTEGSMVKVTPEGVELIAFPF